MGMTCPDCDTILDFVPNDHECPTCHGMRRRATVALQPLVARATLGHITVTVTKKAWAKSWPWLLPYAALTLGAPFLGLVVDGWRGVATSLALNLVGTVAGFYAVTRVISSERTG